MNPLAIISQPEYVFSPSQILRRLRNKHPKTVDGKDIITLPWGPKVFCRPNEVIGDSIRRLGVYDLCVSEVIWRLLDSGEIALDIGANLGYMSSIMATKSGPLGCVYCFEPHPTVFSDLEANVEVWRQDPRMSQFALHQVALSDHAGSQKLYEPEEFSHNRGTATLTSGESDQVPFSASLNVDLRLLDEISVSVGHIGLCKIDVEGHELSVLRGGMQLLRSGRMRDIVFEEHDSPPTSVTEILTEYGYTIFRLVKELWGPRMLPPDASNLPLRSFDAPNYLATNDPARAKDRLRTKGWRILRARIQ